MAETEMGEGEKLKGEMEKPQVGKIEFPDYTYGSTYTFPTTKSAVTLEDRRSDQPSIGADMAAVELQTKILAALDRIEAILRAGPNPKVISPDQIAAFVKYFNKTHAT